MANFNFFKLCRKTDDRDHRTARTETDYRPPWNGHDLVAVRIPISKSFKVYEHSQLTANIAPTTISPTKTSFYKDDIAWWSYCCLGCCCNCCSGLLLNFKLDKMISKVFNTEITHLKCDILIGQIENLFEFVHNENMDNSYGYRHSIFYSFLGRYLPLYRERLVSSCNCINFNAMSGENSSYMVSICST